MRPPRRRRPPTRGGRRTWERRRRRRSAACCGRLVWLETSSEGARTLERLISWELRRCLAPWRDGALEAPPAIRCSQGSAELVRYLCLYGRVCFFDNVCLCYLLYLARGSRRFPLAAPCWRDATRASTSKLTLRWRHWYRRLTLVLSSSIAVWCVSGHAVALWRDTGRTQLPRAVTWGRLPSARSTCLGHWPLAGSQEPEPGRGRVSRWELASAVRSQLSRPLRSTVLT